MYDIEEHAVFAWAAGLPLNKERLERLTVFSGTGDGNYADCHEYRIAELEQLSEDLLRMFRITPVLVQRWRSEGVTFRLCLFTREGTLMGGRIDKRRSLPGDFPGVSYLTAPTQQEIRITGRILRYLAEKGTVQ